MIPNYATNQQATESPQAPNRDRRRLAMALMPQNPYAQLGSVLGAGLGGMAGGQGFQQGIKNFYG